MVIGKYLEVTEETSLTEICFKGDRVLKGL